MPARIFGEIPGVPPGATFESRRELHESGVHRPLQAGISGAAMEGADSLVVSGGYEDDADSGDTIIYTGHGGNDPSTGKQITDQELTAGNAALVVSYQRGYPIRVVRGSGGDPRYSPDLGYRYDGLYDVVRFWDETGSSGHRVFRYDLARRVGQSEGPWMNDAESGPSRGENGRMPRISDSHTRSSGQLGSHIGDVSAALDLVLEMVGTVVSDVEAQATTAIGNARYGEAQQLLDLAERLSAFTNEIQGASTTWDSFGVELADGLPKKSRRKRRSVSKRNPTRPRSSKKRADYGKVAPEDKTSQSEYLIPILEILEELGGAAKSSVVLDSLAQRLSSQFKPADLESLASNPREPRWRNTAQWARQVLANQGLLEPSSQRGVWEISQAGREHLREHRNSEG